MKKQLLLVASLLVAIHPVRAQEPFQLPSLSKCKVPNGAEPWKQKDQTPECRTLELMQAMTPAQKLDHIASTFGPGKPDAFGLPPLHAADGPNGIAAGPVPGPPAPQARHVTAFPNEISLAATWDVDLADQYGAALAEEWRGKGLTEIIGPTLNLMRTWHWGRSAETYGEEPFLAGTLASFEVNGLQRNHVLSMIKHFTANNQDWDRVGHFPDFTGINEEISQRTLEEVYFTQFRLAVTQSSPGGAMCSYNQINGTFSCNNAPVQAQLRTWGLDGAITPDAVFALHDPVAAMHAGVDRLGPLPMLQGLAGKGALTPADVDRMLYRSLLPVFRVGVFDDPPKGNAEADVSSPEHIELSRRVIEGGSVLLKNEDGLLPLIKGSVKSIAVLGAAAGKDAITGEFGPMVHVETLSVPAEAISARGAGDFHVVYQRGNAGVRPLPLLTGDMLRPATGTGHGLSAAYFKSGDMSGAAAVSRVDAAVDFHGVPAPELGKQVFSFDPPKLTWSARWSGWLTPPATGDYVFSVTGGGFAKLRIDKATVAEFSHVNFSDTAFGVIHLTAGKRVMLTLEHSNDYALLGSEIRLGWHPPDPAAWNAAIHAAETADVAIVFAGEQLGEGMDKKHLALPGDQDAFIAAVAAHNKHTVVVLNTSTPVAMPWLSKVAAVLETWYPGQESGSGTAALLFGDADPGGRLPVTFPANESQGPATKPEEYPGVNGVAKYSEGLDIGYRWYDDHKQTPLFPFGFGLSYTDFTFSNVTVERQQDSVQVKAVVKNTGSRAGTTVAEVYVAYPDGAQEPPQLLKAFQKVALEMGQQQQVSITFPVDSLQAWDATTAKWKLWPGRYEFRLGASSRDIKGTASLDISQQP